MKILFHRLIAIASSVIAGCGGGASGSNDTSQVAVTQLTSQIASNLMTNYALEINNVNNALQACYRQYGRSGNALICGANAKSAEVLAFTNTALANIKAIAINKAIDKSAVIEQLNQYRLADITWLNVNTFAPFVTMNTSELAALSPAYKTQVDTYYSNLFLQVNSL